jgi:hypothetical protein
MPLYEYKAKEDGEVITLLRPAADADQPVADPQHKGRTFVRTLSVFSVGGDGAAPSAGQARSGGCGCGNPHGPCHRG